MESSDWTGSCSFTWSEAREQQSLERFRPSLGGCWSGAFSVSGCSTKFTPQTNRAKLGSSKVPPWWLVRTLVPQLLAVMQSTAISCADCAELCLHASEFYVFIGCSSCADRLVVSDQPQFHFSAVDRTKRLAPVLLPPFNLDDVTLQTVWWSLLLNIQSLALKLGEAFSCLFKWASIIKCLCEIRPPAVIGRLMRRWRSVAVQLC